MEELLLWKCKDVRNTLKYFGLISYIYKGSNRSCCELICISLIYVVSDVLSHVMSHVLSHVISQEKSHVMS